MNADKYGSEKARKLLAEERRAATQKERIH
jgi:hypothetical protein